MFFLGTFWNIKPCQTNRIKLCFRYAYRRNRCYSHSKGFSSIQGLSFSTIWKNCNWFTALFLTFLVNLQARKRLSSLKCAKRFNSLIQGHTVRNQTSTALNVMHSWCDIQSQIRARRLYMVTQSRLQHKRLENRLKLEIKLHELEVEWCGGSETMEEILARIQQREEATVKRERAMAYAFSHQVNENWDLNYTFIGLYFRLPCSSSSFLVFVCSGELMLHSI